MNKATDPNISNKSGEKPLHQAVESDQLDIAELLLQYKANPNVIRDDGETPLHLAISRSLKDMVALLIRYGADLNMPNAINSLTPMEYAEDKEEILEIIKNTGINPRSELLLTEQQASPSPKEIKSFLEPEIEDSSQNSLYQ